MTEQQAPGGSRELLDLKGRVALVTGAGQGVGREIALLLARHGAGGVAVNDYFAERARSTASAVEAVGVPGVPLVGDVAEHEHMRTEVARVEAEIGPISILVNNAGNAGPERSISDPTPFWESQPDSWAPWVATNFTGVLSTTHAVVGGMVERGYGRIVTVISDAGRVGEPQLVVYSAAKAAAAGFSRALAKAVGRHGITVNCIALGAMRTPATAHFDEETVGKMLRRYSVKRLGDPADAASLVLFLASDAASWITGQTIPVNGGYSMAL